MIRKRDELVDKQVARHDFNIKERKASLRFVSMN